MNVLIWTMVLARFGIYAVLVIESQYPLAALALVAVMFAMNWGSRALIEREERCKCLPRK